MLAGAVRSIVWLGDAVVCWIAVPLEAAARCTGSVNGGTGPVGLDDDATPSADMATVVGVGSPPVGSAAGVPSVGASPPVIG